MAETQAGEETEAVTDIYDLALTDTDSDTDTEYPLQCNICSAVFNSNTIIRGPSGTKCSKCSYPTIQTVTQSAIVVNSSNTIIDSDALLRELRDTFKFIINQLNAISDHLINHYTVINQNNSKILLLLL